MHIPGFIFIYQLHAFVYIIKAGIDRSFYMLSIVFAWFAYIQHIYSSFFFADSGQFTGGNRCNGINFLSGFLPCINSALQKSNSIVVSNSCQPGNYFLLPSFFCNDQDLLFNIRNECSYPGCKVAIDPNID